MDTRTKNTECSICKNKYLAGRDEKGKKREGLSKIHCTKPYQPFLDYVDNNYEEAMANKFYYPICFNPIYKPTICGNYGYKEGKNGINTNQSKIYRS